MESWITRWSVFGARAWLVSRLFNAESLYRVSPLAAVAGGGSGFALTDGSGSAMPSASRIAGSVASAIAACETGQTGF